MTKLLSNLIFIQSSINNSTRRGCNNTIIAISKTSIQRLSSNTTTNTHTENIDLEKNPFKETKQRIKYPIGKPIDAYNDIPVSVKRRNAASAFLLFSFVFGVYFFSINKMKTVS